MDQFTTPIYNSTTTTQWETEKSTTSINYSRKGEYRDTILLFVTVFILLVLTIFIGAVMYMLIWRRYQQRRMSGYRDRPKSPDAHREAVNKAHRVDPSDILADTQDGLTESATQFEMIAPGRNRQRSGKSVKPKSPQVIVPVSRALSHAPTITSDMIKAQKTEVLLFKASSYDG